MFRKMEHICRREVQKCTYDGSDQRKSYSGSTYLYKDSTYDHHHEY